MQKWEYKLIIYKREGEIGYGRTKEKLLRTPTNV